VPGRLAAQKRDPWHAYEESRKSLAEVLKNSPAAAPDPTSSMEGAKRPSDGAAKRTPRRAAAARRRD
jgi:hypothetical protein